MKNVRWCDVKLAFYAKRFSILLVLVGGLSLTFAFAKQNDTNQFVKIDGKVLYQKVEPKYVQYASVGSDITSSEEGRTRYTSDKIYTLLPSKSLIDFNRKSSVFVNCGEKRSSSGFIFDIASYVNNPDNGFLLDNKFELARNCESKIILTAAHVANKFSSDGCGVYHQDSNSNFQTVSQHKKIYVSSRYLLQGNKNGQLNNDYAFLKLDEKIVPDAKGFDFCPIERINENSCSSDSANIMLSQSYGGGVDELVLSEQCCIDTQKLNPNLGLAHTCHSEGGASGGALIISNEKENTSCVLGLHNSADPDTRHNHATNINDEGLKSELNAFIRKQCKGQ